MKKHIAFCLLFITLFLSSCAYYENVTFTERDNKQFVIYQSQEYYETSAFFVTQYDGVADKNDIELGWYYSFPFSTRFYSQNTDSPVFIYTIGGDTSVYFKHDYDYSIDIFAVENTFAEFVWKDIFVSEKNNLNYSNPIRVNLYSKQYPRIKTYLDVTCVENQWYVFMPNSQTAWIPSEEFIQLLSENGLI